MGKWSMAAVVAIVALFACTSAYAQDSNLHYRLRSKLSNKCIDVSNVSVSNGAYMQQWDCAVQNNQIFSITPTGAGSYRIAAINSVKCLDITGTSASPPYGPISMNANGAQLQQWDCNTKVAQANQNMYIVPAGPAGYYHIKPVHTYSPPSQKCLDVAGVSVANGARIQQWDCNPTPQDNQLWQLEGFGPRIARTNVRSFGYWGTTIRFPLPGETGVCPHPEVPGGYPPVHLPGDVADHVSFYSAYAGQAFCLIDMAAAAGIKAQFIAQDAFNPNAVWPTNPSPLAQNWQGIVDWWVSHLNVNSRITHLSSIYIYDEPFLDLMKPSHGSYPAIVIRDAMQDVILRFRTTGGSNSNPTIAAAWQNVPMMFTEFPGKFNDILVPTAMNWVAFDCYDGTSGWGSAWTSCDVTGQSIPTHLATLKTKLTANQKIVLTPLAYNPGGAPSPSRVDELLWLADRYVELALSDPVVIGLQPWYARYSSGPGVLDIPELKDKWKFLGRALGLGTP